MEKKQNTERNNRGGRPPKSTTDKLKYRVTVKLATPDYYTLKSRASYRETGDTGLLHAEKQGKKRRHIGKRILEGMFP